jgi:hypothetical protein
LLWLSLNLCTSFGSSWSQKKLLYMLSYTRKKTYVATYVALLLDWNNVCRSSSLPLHRQLFFKDKDMRIRGKKAFFFRNLANCSWHGLILFLLLWLGSQSRTHPA